MTEPETTGRRPERPRGELTEGELTGLLERDMTAEVAAVLEHGTAASVREARERTQRIELDLAGRLPYDRWTSEVFFLYAENAMARARAEGFGYGPAYEHPMVTSQYRNARETTVELLNVIITPEKIDKTYDRPLSEIFPKVVAAFEESSERKGADMTRAFNLVAETAVIQEVMGGHGSRWEKGMEDFHGMFAEWKEELAGAVELTDEQEELIDQRLTLMAMVTKARSVVAEAAPELQQLLVKTLPQRGAFPETFLSEVRDLLAERMQEVTAAADELQQLAV